MPADHKIAMTGTPAENRLLDYWSVLDFAMARLLGTRGSFKDRERLDSFRRLTAPFILRRLKTDKSIIDVLPDKVGLDRYAELTPEQAALYEGLVNRVDELRENLSPVERQATDRAFRIGQKKHVTVFRFITPGTFEEKINSMLLEKRDLADLTVSQGEKWIGELSNRELKELLALERG